MLNKNSSTHHLIRGGQGILHHFHLLNSVVSRLFLLGALLFIVFSVVGFFLETSFYERILLEQWWWSHILVFFDGEKAVQRIMQPDGQWGWVYSIRFLHSALLTVYLRSMAVKLILVFLTSFLLSTLLTLMVGFILKSLGKTRSQLQRLRGDFFEAPELVKKRILKSGKASDLRLGVIQLPMIVHSEKQHFLVDGTTGSGKSNALRELLRAIRARGDRAIIWDEGGHYLSEFYDESRDHLLNALDERGRSWHLWHECQDVADFENLAVALIPMLGVQDPFWVLGARTIFSETAYTMRKDPERNVQKLLKLLLTASLENIQARLENTFASTLVSDKIEKTAISIKSVMAAYLKCLRYVKDAAPSLTQNKNINLSNNNNNNDSSSEDLANSERNKRKSENNKEVFSIRRWIREEHSQQWLFLTSLEKKQEALKPLLTAWLDIAINELLSLPENSDRRLWIILDELTSLHKIPTLIKLLSRSRKSGGCVVIGIQNYAQLAETYGSQGAKIISSLLNTRFLFRQPDPDLAAWSARNLGEATLEEPREGISYGAEVKKNGVSVQRVETQKSVVSASEIMTLPDLECFVRLPGNLPITKLQFHYQKPMQVHSPFIERLLENSEANDNAFNSPGFSPFLAQASEQKEPEERDEDDKPQKKSNQKMLEEVLDKKIQTLPRSTPITPPAEKNTTTEITLIDHFE